MKALIFFYTNNFTKVLNALQFESQVHLNIQSASIHISELFAFRKRFSYIIIFFLHSHFSDYVK